MNFIAVLNYEQLDNGMFLTSFARSLAQKKSRGIILHGDSEYTERLIQTGMMREDAMKRSIKDLNHRLIALFADQGISTIGVNGYQKSLIVANGNKIKINKSQIDQLPEYPMLLISNLAYDSNSGNPTPVSVSDLAFVFQRQFDVDHVTIFSTKDSSNIIKEDLPKKVQPHNLDKTYLEEHIPKEFHTVHETLILSTPDGFSQDN